MVLHHNGEYNRHGNHEGDARKITDGERLSPDAVLAPDARNIPLVFLNLLGSGVKLLDLLLKL